MFRRRIREPVQGRFVVTSITQVAGEGTGSRYQDLQLRGQLVSTAGPGAIVTTVHGFSTQLPLPEEGTSYPATWDARATGRFRIDFSAAAPTLAATGRVRRAEALGMDPSTLPPWSPPQAGPGLLARAANATLWETNAAPLPDGVTPVQVPEANRLRASGERGTAVITAIDYLRVLPKTTPSKEATVANVALRVTRADGSTYAAFGRFGFATAARREAIGKVGATVPVLLDPGDISRVTLDPARLPSV